MGNPHISTAFGDLLDPRFQKIFYEELPQLKSMLPEVYDFVGTNGREDMRFSEVGTLPDFTEFQGTVDYGSSSQGYDTVLTPLEFTRGIQIEKKLFINDQYSIMNQRPKALATAASRKREKDGARMFNNATSVDTYFYVNSEGVALVSDSHTTTSGASTSVGFDNKGTAPLSATALSAAKIVMWNFRGDQAEKLDVTPDELFIPDALFEEGFEIANSLGKLDGDMNNPNVHRGTLTLKQWRYMTDENNWFLSDSALRRQMVMWTDRVPIEFAMAEDLDTLMAKWRGYMYYALGHVGWRWVYGGIVG